MNTDAWTERWPEHPVIRTFDPPREVQVDISKALPLGRGGAARADYVSMRVKSSSVYLSGLRPALQTHWFQIHDGQWLAAITAYVTDAAGTNSLELDMIVTADAHQRTTLPLAAECIASAVAPSRVTAAEPAPEHRLAVNQRCT